MNGKGCLLMVLFVYLIIGVITYSYAYQEQNEIWGKPQTYSDLFERHLFAFAGSIIWPLFWGSKLGDIPLPDEEIRGDSNSENDNC